MVNSYLKNIRKTKIILENVIFHNLYMHEKQPFADILQNGCS